MNQNDVNRRKFIKVSTTAAATFLVGCPEKGTVRRSPIGEQDSTRDTEISPDQAILTDATPDPEVDSTAQGRTPDGQVHGSETTDMGQAECAPTSRDITGPFWREGIPVRQNFDQYGDPGQKLALSGIVQDVRCQPIANAVIEMWHATPSLVPANELSRGDSVDYDRTSETYRYYGQFATNAQGEYAMSTKKPGWYLNGPNFRPSHIHVKIYVNQVESLTTQLYFEGDPFISGDPWASVAPRRAVALQTSSNGDLSGTFNFTVTT